MLTLNALSKILTVRKFTGKMAQVLQQIIRRNFKGCINYFPYVILI